MKVMQVMAGSDEGGLEKHFVELANALARKGHEVIAVAHAKYRDRFSADVRFIALDLSGSRRNPLTLLALYRLIKKEAPDVVHAQANKAAAILSPLRQFLQPKMVATLHNLKRNTAMFRHFDVLIAVSHAISTHVKHSDIRVIYNGIVPPKTPSQATLVKLRKSLHVTADKPLVLSVGRLVVAKGFDLLLAAWQAIDATLLIAGDGPERVALEEQAVALGLTDRVRFLGMRNDVSGLMALSDMVVIASRNEGFPYVMVEALHMRRPLVSTMISDVGNVLPPNYLVPLEDIVSLQATLKQALADPFALAEAYEPVFAYAANDLSLDSMVEKTVRIYAELKNEQY
jgi:glycosyltransferase involved in cell wall biosynthesis